MELRKSLFMCVVGWFGVVSRPTKPDVLSICSRWWSNGSVWVVDKACRVKHRRGSQTHAPSQEKRQVFQLRSESRLLSFSHSQGWPYSLLTSLFFEKLKNEDFFQTKLKLKPPPLKGERYEWVNIIVLCMTIDYLLITLWTVLFWK